MTGPATRRLLSLAGLAVLLGVAGCTSFYEIPIETPIQAKLDVSPFQRVLVVGFIAGGSDDVDANLETVRLLRSQLRTKAAQLKVIEADPLPLAELASEQISQTGNGAADGSSKSDGGSKADGANLAPVPAIGAKSDQSTPQGSQAAQQPPDAARQEPAGLPKKIKDQKDLEAYESIFANAAFWKKLGEEFQSPLIVTGTILFTPHQRSGFVQREQEQYDAYGRRTVVPVRTYMERKGYILNPKFIFIDGRTGTPLYSETFREEILYNPQQNTPALSSYFELMDRIIPNFLSTLSSQKVKGTRILLK